jgi:4-hydroxybenzoyl-CoA reductase subunit alpha
MKFSVIGKRLPRKNDSLMATGKAMYTSDLSLPGMLYGKILRSPYPHAKILNIDTKKAERLPGVKRVITGKDTLGVKYGIMGILAHTLDEYGLAMEKVRYIGDEVAAVAATSEDIAEEALDLIEVEYEELPAVFDPMEAMNPEAPKIHEHVENNICLKIDREFGEVEKAFYEADYIREDEFFTQPVEHVPLEPHASLASYDVSGSLTLWATTQTPYHLQKNLGKTLGIKENKIRVIKPYLGGGFGDRGEMSACDFCAALLSIKTGKHVKIMYTRAEEFNTSRRRHPMRLYLKSGVKKDGTVFVKHCRIICDTGAYNSTGHITINIPFGIITTTYRLPNIRYEGYCVYTNNQISGGMRGFGAPQLHFAVDLQLNLIAGDLGIDPIELRVKNATKAGDITANKAKIRSCGFTKCLNQSRDKTNWDKKWGKVKKRKGIGIGTMSYISGTSLNYSGSTYAHSSATIKLMDDGTISLLTGASDMGQGSDGTLAQIAAEELGVHLEDIRVTSADTELTPVDFGAYSSRTTFFAGNAVKSAASDVKRQIFEEVAKKLEANVEDLEAKDRRIYVKGSMDRGMSFTEAVLETNKARKGMPIIGKGFYNPTTTFNVVTNEGDVTPAHSFASYIAEVEVDKETGEVKVTSLTAVHDCGTAINPMRIEGQLEGSVQMGLGYVLSEKLYIDKGQNLNPSFLDYKFPTAIEMPVVKTVIVEENEPEGPYGAKGIGESSVIPVVPAIANAIYDAIGVSIKELPITPEKVLKALKNRKRKLIK